VTRPHAARSGTHIRLNERPTGPGQRAGGSGTVQDMGSRRASAPPRQARRDSGASGEGDSRACSVPGLPTGIHALQRAAGNAAVASLMNPADKVAVQRWEPWDQATTVGPLDALDARDASIEARAAAASSGLPGFSDGPQDAYRHAYWSCLMAMSIGDEQAKDVGDVHEEQATTHPFVTLMDTHNNAIGRFLARQAKTKDDVHGLVMAALKRGNLLIIKNWRERSDARRDGQPLPDAGPPVMSNVVADDLETGIRPLEAGKLDVAKANEEWRQAREKEIIALLRAPMRADDARGIAARSDRLRTLCAGFGAYWSGTYRERFAAPRADDELVTLMHQKLSRAFRQQLIDILTLSGGTKKSTSK